MPPTETKTAEVEFTPTERRLAGCGCTATAIGCGLSALLMAGSALLTFLAGVKAVFGE